MPACTRHVIAITWDGGMSCPLCAAQQAIRELREVRDALEDRVVWAERSVMDRNARIKILLERLRKA